MSAFPQSKFWRRTRVTFRWCRIVLWLLLLALVCALLWVNRVGVPDFAKQAILRELEAKGLRVSFKRMRLLWYRGIVAEDVRFDRGEGGGSLLLSARTMSFRPDLSSLARRQFRLHGFSLAGGAATVPVLASNLPPRSLAIEDLQVQVDFLSSNRWQLSSLEGQWLGIKFSLSGSLTNGPSLWGWKRPDRPASAQGARWWNLAVGELEKVRFTPSLQVRGTFSADAAHPELATAQVSASTLLFESSWGGGRKVEAHVSLQPVSPEAAEVSVDWSSSTTQTRWGQLATLTGKAQAEIPYRQPCLRKLRGQLESSGANTLWGRARVLQINGRLDSTEASDWAADADLALTGQAIQSRWGETSALNASVTSRPNPENHLLARAVCRVSAQGWRSPWFSASGSQVVLETQHPRSNAWPQTLQASLTLDRPELTASNLLREIRAALRTAAEREADPKARTSRLAGVPAPVRARACQFQGSGVLPPLPALRAAATNANWSVRLAGASLRGRVELTEAELPNLPVAKLEAGGDWQAPTLTLDRIGLSLWSGEVKASSRWDTASGEISAAVNLAVDPGHALPFLVTNAPAWRSAVVWDDPPRIQTQVRLNLPDQRYRPPGWMRATLEQSEVTGEIRCGAGSIKGVDLESARGGFGLSNRVFWVEGLRITRPEGFLDFALRSPLEGAPFQARVQSTIHPSALKPLFKTGGAGKALDYFQFTSPPELQLQAAGRWKDLGQTTLGGSVRLTNATFRGQAVRRLAAGVARTNQCVDLLDVLLIREEGQATADQIRVDLAEESVNLTNLHSTVDAGAVAAAIGPHIVKTLAPYQFAAPPRVFFEGRVGLRSNSGLDDARFDVEGGPFAWWRFKLDRVNARLHWLDHTLSITNFDSLLRGGQARGHAEFDFAGQQGTRFAFDMQATNVDAKPLMRDLFPQFTNTLEGAVGGHLRVTSANTLDERSWQGEGNLSLKDGLLWDIPVFKILSPVMNAVVPGIGNSRARHASGSFLITNSVVATRDLEVSASGMRLQFEGTTDFEGALNAKVEAELFRDTPGFGLLISRVFWPVTKVFAYRIQGVLGNPKLEPLYIPKLLMAPFHPFRTLRELFSEDRKDEAPPPPTSLPSPTNQVNFPQHD